MDERSRRREREARDGTPEGRARSLQERVRRGDLAHDHLLLAGYLGDPGAALALGGRVWTWGRGCVCVHLGDLDPGGSGKRAHGFDCVGRPSRQEVQGPSAHFMLSVWLRGIKRYFDPRWHSCAEVIVAQSFLAERVAVMDPSWGSELPLRYRQLQRALAVAREWTRDPSLDRHAAWAHAVEPVQILPAWMPVPPGMITSGLADVWSALLNIYADLRRPSDAQFDHMIRQLLMEHMIPEVLKNG